MAHEHENKQDSEVLDYDAPCGGCGYNLRGLKPVGVCPECERAIADSLRGPLLRFADQKWLKRSLLGMTVVYLGVLSLFILTVIVIVFGIAIKTWTNIDLSIPQGSFLSGAIDVLLIVLLILIPLAYPVGCWLFTVPDPGSVNKSRGRLMILRLTGIGLMPLLWAWTDGDPFWIGRMALRVPSISISNTVLVEIASHVMIIFLAVHLWLLLDRMNHFAQRSSTYPLEHKRVLKRYSRYVKWGALGLIGLHWLLVLFSYTGFRGGAGVGGGLPILGWLSIMALFGPICGVVKTERLVAGALAEEAEGVRPLRLPASK